MSKAREIADERLATGEISAEEHAELIKVLNEKPGSSATKGVEPSNDKAPVDWKKSKALAGVIVGGLWGFVLAERLGGHYWITSPIAFGAIGYWIGEWIDKQRAGKS